MTIVTNTETQQQETLGPRDFSASRLSLIGFMASVLIRRSDVGGRITVAMEGTREQLDGIDTVLSGNHLTIRANGRYDESNTVNIGGSTFVGGSAFNFGDGSSVGSVYVGGSVSGTTIVTGNGNVISRGGAVVTGSATPRMRRITIDVPAGCPITSDGANGSILLGDVGGTLTVRGLQASSRVDAQYVRDTILNMNSSSHVTIDRIEGFLQARLSSNSILTVESGHITTLDVSTSSSARAKLNLPAVDTARLSASSSSRIDVLHVKERPAVSISSSASIRVGNWR